MRDPKSGTTEARIFEHVQTALRSDDTEIRSRQIRALIRSIAEEIDKLSDRIERLEDGANDRRGRR